MVRTSPAAAVTLKATLADARDIHDLVNLFAQRGDMLPRTMGEVYENLRDFFVARAPDGSFLGCVALHLMWSDLAEVKSLAVAEAAQGRGVGSLLVQACIDEARALGLERIFALTYRPAFFERLGFQVADVMTLPRKVWNECYRCPKFPSCNEIALTLDLRSAPPEGEPRGQGGDN
ncbi:MAG TPA: N-acetyltransferase [Dehalococcoidia bacterium]|nr:N-acetyltransferase [Dehalococcoidia bacterium]